MSIIYPHGRHAQVHRSTTVHAARVVWVLCLWLAGLALSMVWCKFVPNDYMLCGVEIESAAAIDVLLTRCDVDVERADCALRIPSRKCVPPPHEKHPARVIV